MRYEVVLEKQEEGGYTVTVPALPGCISEGDTKKEALDNIKDAVKGYLACYHNKIRREHPSAEFRNIAVVI